MDVLIYSPVFSPRLTYIVSFLFKNLLGLNDRFTSSISEFESFTGVKINYSDQPICTKEIWLRPHTLLFEKGIKTQEIEITFLGQLAVFFTRKNGGDLTFDPLAASFYLLSRYEEYLPFAADQHGRFSAHQSLAYKNGFIDQPIIHFWLKKLVNIIQKKHPSFTPKPTKYNFKPTYDIDIPWAFKHRGLRGWARAALDIISGKWPLTKARYQVQKGQITDPFYCFELLQQQHKTYNIRPQIFWLIGDVGKHDISPDFRLPAFQKLIQSTAEWSNTGLHPSYRSNERPTLIKTEKYRLENILQKPIAHSRQHYLKLHFPQTYRQLIDAGIQHDYSMGFADHYGYRAGTSEPFLWYDLEKETTSNLHIHPFVVMDVTLKQYLGLNPLEAAHKLEKMQDLCRENGLSFSILWHNSSFSKLHGWEGWQEVYWGLFE